MAQASDLLQAASEGNLSVFEELTEDGHIDYYKDKDGSTLLSIAARKGHRDLVKLLLAKDARTGIRNSDGKTPLVYAAENGYKEIVELMLNDENLLKNSKSLRKAVSETVSSAAAGGHVSLLKYLIQAYNYDLQLHEAERIFYSAAAAGHKGMVKLLLGRYNVKINGRDDTGNTALFLAVQACHKDVVAMLLEREDINIHEESRDQSALSAALDLGHEDLAEMLYARDRHSREGLCGALYYATSNDDIKTAKWLLAREEINVNTQDWKQRTPLHMAVERGYTEILKLLLARHDIMINAENADKETPLHTAVNNDRTEAVELLLGTKKVNLMARNKENKTPIQMAVNTGQARITRLLLGSDGAKGCIITPLLYDAATKGYTKITKLLLTIDESGVNGEIDGSRTLLHIAAENGHTGIVKFLLEADEINVNAKTRDNETPLFSALQNGHTDVIRLLLARDDLDLKAAEFSGGYLINWAAEAEQDDLMDLQLARECITCPSRTPLTWSSEKGYLETLWCLLQRVGTDVNSKDSDGRTPLSRAAEKGHDTVVEILLQCGADRNLKDIDGRTPLSWAARNEHEEVVKQLVPHDTATLFLLIEEGNKRAIDFILRFNPNLEQKNDRGQTALHLTARLGHQDITRALILQGVDVNSKDDNGKTPLQLAIGENHGDLVQEFLAIKASPEGITCKQWRDAFGKHNEDVVQLSGGPGGEHYVNFPTTILVSELLQISLKSKSSLYLVSDDLNSSAWSKIPSDVFDQSRLEPNKLQSTTARVNDNCLNISISLWLSFNSYFYDHALVPKGDNKVSIIIWRIMRPTNPSNPWNTVLYLSTLPYGWIPEDGVDMFRQLFDHVKSQWLELCHKFGNHLAKRRLDQMESKGKSPEMIDFLARDAQNLANLRNILVDQTSAAESFIRRYCSNYNANHIPKSLLELLKNDIELDMTKRLADLDQTVRDLLNMEFAWITIHETRVSTKLGQNVMLLTYVSIFYLPLGFCAYQCINSMLAGALGNPKYHRYKDKNAIHVDSNHCLLNYFSNYIQHG